MKSNVSKPLAGKIALVAGATRGAGRGIACMERAIKTPFGSAAFVKVNEDGTSARSCSLLHNGTRT